MSLSEFLVNIILNWPQVSRPDLLHLPGCWYSLSMFIEWPAPFTAGPRGIRTRSCPSSFLFLSLSDSTFAPTFNPVWIQLTWLWIFTSDVHWMASATHSWPQGYKNPLFPSKFFFSFLYRTALCTYLQPGTAPTYPAIDIHFRYLYNRERHSLSAGRV